MLEKIGEVIGLILLYALCAAIFGCAIALMVWLLSIIPIMIARAVLTIVFSILVTYVIYLLLK